MNLHRKSKVHKSAFYAFLHSKNEKNGQFFLDHITPLYFAVYNRLGGATVARLTPVQKVACSTHVGLNI